MHGLISDPLGLKAAANRLRDDLRTYMSSIGRKLEEISDHIKDQNTATASALQRLNAIESTAMHFSPTKKSSIARILAYRCG